MTLAINKKNNNYMEIIRCVFHYFQNLIEREICAILISQREEKKKEGFFR
jgi:hypothetical protein